MKKKIIIDGMSCQHCQKKVESALKNLNCVENVKVKLAKKEAIVEMNEEISDEKLKEVIVSCGFQVQEISDYKSPFFRKL